MAECKMDTSEIAIKKRLDQYNNLFKKYPQSKCTEDKMSDVVKQFYEAYREYPIDMIGCPDRDKAFIISNDCNNFKYLPKDYYPGKEDDDNKYSRCIVESGSNCDDILKDIENKRLKHTIESSLDSCNKQHGSCGVYNVNGIMYKQSINFEYIPYLLFAMASICCFFMIIILLFVFF